MGYKYKDRNLRVGTAWKDDDGFSHPYNWASSWSADDKKKWGVTFEKDVDTSFDERFYWSKGVEKNIADQDAKDKDGKQLYERDGTTKLINLGLKTIWVRKTKEYAKILLAKSDWYVTRKAETDTDIPSDISTYRTAVRTATKTIEDKINACSKLADFIKLFDVPLDKDSKPTGKAPIYDFPDEV